MSYADGEYSPKRDRRGMLPGSSEAASERIWGGVGLTVLARAAAFGAGWLGLDRAVGGIPVLACAVALILWGCVIWARGKGYPGWVGALGLLWLMGFLVLYALPDRCPDAPKGSG